MQQQKTPSGNAGALTLWIFSLTTFLSALLLFSIQPMFAKMVLPLLGGSPSVWAVALAFFQGALLAGYCYAHGLIRLVPIKWTGFVHLGFCFVALLSLPIVLPGSWSEPPPGDVYLWQLGLFTVAIGLPFMAVAANAPLLQAWFARSGHPQGSDPYFLYAASNSGSLLALLSYPFLLEPIFGLTVLSGLWMAGFCGLVAALAVCFAIVFRRSRPVPAAALGGAHNPDLGIAPQWLDRLGWLGLAFVPAALLTAFTTHVATDVASAPLIWVVPLSLYLLTFVIVFRERALIPMRVLLVLHLAAVFLALLQMSQIWHESWFLTSGLGAAAFVTSALVAHRTLYEARPDAQHLTGFYLWMALGGVLGGLFAALAAPKLFSEVFEYPLLLALSMACRPGVVRALRRSNRERIAAGAVLAIGVCIIVSGQWVAHQFGLTFGGWGLAPVLMLVLGLVLLAFWVQPARQLATAFLMFLAIAYLPSGVHRGNAERSYFGVYRVIQSDDGQYNVLQHGTTLHGAQRMFDDDGNPISEPKPVTYYYDGGPMAQVVGMVRWSLGEAVRDAQFGVVGLGAGALACHSGPEEDWRFYEIDPIVEKIAKSESFSYLAKCQPEAPIVIGDARLTLAREPDLRFDLLIVDAFSSDAVPVHLLTEEALELYLSKLKPAGVGLLHISNRYLDLEGVLQATFAGIDGVTAFTIEDRKPSVGYAFTGSVVVVFSKDVHLAHRFLRIRGARTLRYADVRPWSDDASDILGPFLSKLNQ